MKRLIRAEYLKARSLSSFWIGLGCAFIPVTTFALFLYQLRSSPDLGVLSQSEYVDMVFQHLNLATIPVLVMGAMIGGTDFARSDPTRGGTNGWTATFLAAPDRSRVLGAKLLVLLPLCLAVAVLAMAGIGVLATVVDDVNVGEWLVAQPSRLAAMGLWLICVGILGFSLVLMVGSVPVPLTLMILNYSAVSPAFLLAPTGYWVRFFPELAAGGLTFPATMSTNELLTEATQSSLAQDVLLNWLVILAWMGLGLVAACASISRRDMAS